MNVFVKPKYLNLLLCVIGFCVTCSCFSTMALVQKNNKRNDERRENERVKAAEEKLQAAQKRWNEIKQDMKTASQAVAVSDRTLRSAFEKIRDEKESAESRLDSKSGIPATIEDLKSARATYASLADPIRLKVQATDEWKLAEEEATNAKSQKAEILDTVVDITEREKLLAPLEPLIAKPLEIETKAILSNKAAAIASEKVEQLKDRLVELRRKFPESKVDEDPQVKKAKAAHEEAEKKHQKALRELQVLKQQATKQNAAVADSQRQVAKAKEADRKNK